MNTIIQQLAESAGFQIVEHPQELGSLTVVSNYAATLEKFADLIAQIEREACAKICEETRIEYPPKDRPALAICASIIRARTSSLNPRVAELVDDYKRDVELRAQYRNVTINLVGDCIKIVENSIGYKQNFKHVVDNIKLQYGIDQ